MYPLKFAKENQFVEVVALKGGRGFIQKMINMGIIKGSKIKVVSKHPNGPIIVEIKNSRFVLGKNIVDKIFVK